MSDIKKEQERLANTLRACNEAKIESGVLIEQIANIKTELALSKKDKETVLTEIEKAKKQLEELSCLLVEKKSQVNVENDKLETLKSETLKFVQEKTQEGEGFKKAIFALNEEYQKASETVSEKQKELDKIEEEKTIVINDQNNIITEKISKSEALDLSITQKNLELIELGKREEAMSDNIKILDTFIVPKEQSILKLKEEISKLEQEKDEKLNKIKIVEEEINIVASRKKLADKELEEAQLKAGAIIEREAMVSLKEKQLSELYKKIGKEIKL